MRQASIDVLRKERLGADKVKTSECFIRFEQIGDMWANHIGDLCEYPYHLAMYFSLYFAYAIVGFHYFGGLDKHGSAGSRLVVNYTANFAFVHRRNG